MFTIEDLHKTNSIYNIPKTVTVNKGIMLDFRLFNALINPSEERDYKYDFDVFLPKYGINLQRPYVWEHCQQNEFINSILLEKPIEPVIVVQHICDQSRENAINYIIDGKQRLMTIQKFGHNEFPIIVNDPLQPYAVYYKDFSDELKRYFQSRVNYLTANVYYSYWNAPITDDMKIILFNYYNFAGTPQTQSHKDKLQALLNQEKND